MRGRIARAVSLLAGRRISIAPALQVIIRCVIVYVYRHTLAKDTDAKVQVDAARYSSLNGR